MLTVIIGIVVGLALGLSGSGGSIFAIPLLIYVAGVPPLEAITISLVAVTVMSLIGTISASYHQLIEYRAGLIFAAGGMAASPAGIHLAHSIDEALLLHAFSILLVAIALLMALRAQHAKAETDDLLPRGIDDSRAVCRFQTGSDGQPRRLSLSAPCSIALTLCGLGTGLLSGLFGVGGGFVIVPALTSLSQLGIHRAVATSMFVITLIGCTALTSALISGRSIPLTTTALFLTGGIVGTLTGRQLSSRVRGPILQRIFAALLTLTAISLFRR